MATPPAPSRPGRAHARLLRPLGEASRQPTGDLRRAAAWRSDGWACPVRRGLCTAARVGLGAVAPTVLLVNEAAAALVGSRLEETALEDAAEACRSACNPIDDKRGTVAYRTKVAGVLLKRAARIAAERAKGV